MTPDPSAKNAPDQGAFERDMNYITDRILDDPTAQWPVEAGRYRLMAARACPWAHRTVITRRLLGLEDAISLSLAAPTHGQSSWNYTNHPDGVDPALRIERLQQAYFNRVPDYPKGITVPAIAEIETKQVVTNDFPQITLDFESQWTRFHRDGAWDLYPQEHRAEIDDIDEGMFHDVNNGVYKCGFTRDQGKYEEAFDALFARLDEYEERLRTRRFLVGDSITEADIHLYPTLIRFDAVYHGHFKCNRSKIAEMPVLRAYLQDLYQTPGFGDTTDFQEIKEHYYIVHTEVNPRGTVPRGPSLDWLLEPHHREELGGRPFGDGTAPSPVRAGEEVTPGHRPI